MKEKRRILVLPRLEQWMKQVEQNPPDIEGFRISRLQYLIHLFLQNKQDKHPGAWSVLNMEILLEQVPRAGKYMDFLEQEDIIERKNYSAGRNSTLYRIREEGKTEFRILTDMEIVNRVEKSQQKMKLRNSKKYPSLNRTIKQVQIDHEAAFAFIEEEYLHTGNDARRNFLLAEVEKIYTGDIYIKVNDTNFRLDTNFTHLPGELSEFLSIGGQPVVELDITNSQPFFAATLFDMRPEVEAVMTKYLGSSFTIYTKSLQLYNKEDVKLYTSLVCSGKFYDFMADQFTAQGIPFENRKDLKRQLFVVFFGKGISYKYNKAADGFRKTFPNVHRLFYAIKEKQHNQLPNLLTRIESRVMLDRVVPAINSKYPDLHLLTKHDSVEPFKQLVPDGVRNSFEIGKMMFDTIEKVTGLRPSGKAKRYPGKIGEVPFVNKGPQ